MFFLISSCCEEQIEFRKIHSQISVPKRDLLVCMMALGIRGDKE